MSGATGLPAADIRRYRRIVMTITILGTYLVAINTMLLGLALPAIAKDLASQGAGADWVITVYLLALAVALPGTGYLASRLGKRATFLGCLAVFAVGAAVSALATGLPVMLVGRALQGLGGGAILPLSMTMVYELYPPHRRGAALGTWGVALAAAPALGPPAAGWLLTASSWRWIFGALLAFALVGLLLGMRYLRDLQPPTPRQLDLRGWFAAATLIGCLVVASRYALAWGVRSPQILASLVVAGAAGLVLLRTSGRRAAPILDLRVVRSRAFASASALIAVVTVSQFAKLNFLPIELQVVRGLTALEVGLLLAPAGLAISVAMPVGGRLADRFGPRRPVLIGLAVAIASMVAMGLLTATTSFLALVMIVTGHGLGAGLMFSPLQLATMNGVRPELVAEASSITQLNRQISGAVGVAALAAVLVARLGSVAPEVATTAQGAAAQAAYNELFLTCAVLLAIGGTCVAGLPARGGSSVRGRAARRAELPEPPSVTGDALPRPGLATDT